MDAGPSMYQHRACMPFKRMPCLPRHTTRTTRLPHPAQPTRTQPNLRWLCNASAECYQRATGCSQVEAQRLLSKHPTLAEASDAAVMGNASFLGATYSLKTVQQLLVRSPQLLAHQDPPLGEWHKFLSGYGLPDAAVAALFGSTPEALQSSTPYQAGLVIRWLKDRLGLADDEIADRIIGVYPRILQVRVEALDELVEVLRSRDFDDASVRNLLIDFPLLLERGAACEEMLVVVDRIRAGCRNKYVVSGTYWV